ncbi:MAG TPA: SDR family NAD(P)-dependent oxidoreductase [Bryobacteraceae bacterium]|nr:SDR family NAD(P)-dependent oxidoreductase [Bryobacteraceae bacterium]
MTGEVFLHSLKGKRAVVTGGAQGLGLAIARGLAASGASVTLGDLDASRVESGAATLREEGLDVDSAVLDVSNSAAVQSFFASLSSLDILVNNAGVQQRVCALADLSDQEWHRVLNVNLSGVFYCSRAAARLMQRRESGTIINLSSVNGLSPAALVSAYNASKAAVISLTKTLALELASYGIRVNAVCPGPVMTQMNEQVMADRAVSLQLSRDEMIERIRKSIPLGRWGEPEDIASMVTFFASPAAGWITGEVIRVSGGLEGVSATPPRQPALEAQL